MGKKVVAESVESLEAMDKLRQIGVDFVQGFAMGAPVSIDSIGAW
jgi:EAL domain-containing protein (putative c-di-GMP-specific phosphodiesterase class I)